MCCEKTAWGRRRDFSRGLGVKGHLLKAHSHQTMDTATGNMGNGATAATQNTDKQQELDAQTRPLAVMLHFANGVLLRAGTRDVKQINEQHMSVQKHGPTRQRRLLKPATVFIITAPSLLQQHVKTTTRCHFSCTAEPRAAAADYFQCRSICCLVSKLIYSLFIVTGC